MPQFISALLAILICFGLTTQSFAANFAVAPFKVNGGSGYDYLKTAIPPMFSSRLFLNGVNEPISNQEQLLSQNPVGNKEQAEKLRKQFNADYLIYGSITLIGDSASLDVNVISEHTFWQKASQNNINNLFNAVQTVADSINHEVFGVRTSAPAPTANRVPINDAIISNEVNAAATNYLNPELRYQGAETQRGRTRPLDYLSHGFEIADYNDDGKVEVAILGLSEVNIYEYDNDILKPLATYRLPSTDQPVRMRTLKYNGDNLLVVSSYNKSTKDPSSLIFKMNDNKLTVLAKSRYYLSVESIKPKDSPVLVGQGGDKTRFVRGDVYQMNFDGATVTRGRPLGLPRDANVFNFSWLPGLEKFGGDHLIVVNKNDRLVVFSKDDERLYQTEEIYASTGVGVSVTRDIMGFESPESKLDMLYYYVPMRVLITDLDNNGQYEAITSKPVSTAASFLNNYRTYSQSEIHTQIWDGVGLGLLWKTRRIKGTIVDVTIADPNNDGVLDLVVNVNTHPGTLGVSKIKNLLVLYPLDIESVNPNAINYNE